MSSRHINVHVDFFEDPQTEALMGQLGRGSEVLPIKLWRTCGKFFPKDGRLTGYSAEALEKTMGWWGEKGKAVKVMMMPAVDYLGRDQDGTYFAKGWLDHNGHIWALKERGRINAEKKHALYAARCATSTTTSDAVQGAPSVLPVKKKGAEAPPNGLDRCRCRRNGYYAKVLSRDGALICTQCRIEEDSKAEGALK